MVSSSSFLPHLGQAVSPATSGAVLPASLGFSISMTKISPHRHAREQLIEIMPKFWHSVKDFDVELAVCCGNPPIASNLALSHGNLPAGTAPLRISRLNFRCASSDGVNKILASPVNGNCELKYPDGGLM